ncbi:starch phosphorylase [Hasllibacter halocynthiae]|uniref:Alpha-1,4 glucan phosphorylase n=1 Tax=Hasllibacter halocynthiae TaxID=595589 RepID=A0A2T0X226_9RHOB|nr:glycogen/starch/alpha-glucan phosphorylase [Hasllibacter halocynthiae]PRY92990.1 starch phosphorylase [Hasllibacter halocynthiae]
MPKDTVAAADLGRDLPRRLMAERGVAPEEAPPGAWAVALGSVLRERIGPVWVDARRGARGAKHVSYLSMEFLVGRLMGDALRNLGLFDEAEEALAVHGVRLADVLAEEPDPALGNGGLGRLAACFLESLASLGVPAFGYGLRYEHGLFAQSLEGGRQVERADHWLHADMLSVRRPARDVTVGFAGHVANGAWHPSEFVDARAHDVPVPGWGGEWCATLRLWQPAAHEPFDLQQFNAGDHVGAQEGEARARALARVLYPEDGHEAGQALRLKQEYLLCAASVADVLRRHEAAGGTSADLPDRAAIQMNDTHPALAAPELVRLLADERGVEMGEAIRIARACLGYTNHTLLPEALEAWPEGLMWHLLPRHMQIICEIDARHYAETPQRPGSVIDHGVVRMGDLAFVMSHRVNGVSALHTDLMKRTVFEGLHRAHPGRIVNQTNGVTPRRWLRGCNPGLAALYDEALGPGWVMEPERLRELEPMLDDAGWLDRFMEVKRANQARLAGACGTPTGFMHDVHVKRIHEYKRQHLNLLETIALWQDLRDGGEHAPRLKIFAGKAAPGYALAKEIIRAINDVAAVVNADPATRDRLRVAFLPDYDVSLAELLIPAADLSEQISTAGKEASGTGNMKFALNGAPTVGTLDGANVEIREHVGAENFFLFGLTAEEAMKRRALPDHAARAIVVSHRLERALDALQRGAFSPGEPARHASLAADIRRSDHFLVASDFDDYWRAQREVDAAFADPARWARMAVANALRSGWFSSDRTIRGYMDEVWNVAPVPGLGSR